jgi:Bul1 C terminus
MAIHSSSRSGHRPGFASKMPFKPFSKTSINITLTGGESCTYSTLDPIKGTAEVSVKGPTSFSHIEVALIGSVTTLVDAAGRSGAIVGGESSASQQFLKLTQPLDLETLGITDSVLQPGSFKVPFTFVVPTQLLPRACSHRSTSGAVRDSHLKLPPTMGDKRVVFGLLTSPDFAPDPGVKIEYCVLVTIFEGLRSVDKVARKIRIIPAVDEEPPLSFQGEGPYVLRKEKSLRKSFFGSKIGRVAVSASEPSSFRLPAENSEICDPSTFVRVSIRFDPAHANDSPPILSSLCSKLLINTSWATTPRIELKHQVVARFGPDFRDVTSDALTDEVSLSSLTLSSNGVQWTRHDSFDPRASIVSTRTVASEMTMNQEDIIISPTKSWTESSPFYTASIMVPLSLPASKHTWLPTFHTCLVSRTYALSLNLAVSSGSSSSKLELIVPIQVSKKHTEQGQAELDLADAHAQALMEADEAFVARSTLSVQHPPSDIVRVGFPSLVGGVSMRNEGERPPEYGRLSGWSGGTVHRERISRF